MIPEAVTEHDECKHATAKQDFPMAGHGALKISHTASVKPARISREKIFTPKAIKSDFCSLGAACAGSVAPPW
jgi:hypothetical protein